MNRKKKIYQVASPYFAKNDINWINKRVTKILKGRLSTGPFTKEFEKNFADFIGTKYAVFLNSCTSALEISIKYLNLKNNDEVIVPVQSFIADGMCVTSQGGKVVFAEIDQKNFCLNLEEIKRLYSNKTKAVIMVYFGGYLPKNIFEIRDFCKKKKILLIEDCAHAVGSEHIKKKAGSIGDSGCFSFFSTKTITTGEGGMLTTNNKKLFELALSLRERGRDLTKKNMELYKHDWRTCRVPEFSALLGVNQFSKIDAINAHRNKIVKIYNNSLKKIPWFNILDSYKNQKLSIWKHVTIITNPKLNRKILQKKLYSDYGININWAYDPPLHLQPIYKKLSGTKIVKLKNTEQLMSKHFHLPLHMMIKPKDANYIVKSLIDCSKKILKIT